MRARTQRSILAEARNALLGVAIAGLAGCALGAALRYGLVERDSLGIACESGAADWRCAPRSLVIQAFLHQAFAILSLLAAAVAAWRRRRALAGLAIVAGVAGMMLYRFEWSALGTLAGALVLARLERDRQQDGEAERQH